MIIQFTELQHPSMGGLYTSAQMFDEILDTKIIEIVPKNHVGPTFGDYQIAYHNSGIFKAFPLPNQTKQVSSQINPKDISLVIIHGLWRLQTSLGFKFAHRYDIPYLLVPHGMLDPHVFTLSTLSTLSKSIWLRFFGRSIIQNAEAVICASEREAEKASPYLQGTSVQVCSWGVTTPDWKEQSSWRAEVRAKLGIAEHQRVLIFFGRLHRMKRPLETLNAFHKLNLPDWVLIFVGFVEPGGGAEQIESFCDGNRIRYYPPVTGVDKWKYLSAADAFVNLSHRENFGLSVAEAAATGLPLLISDGVDIFPVLERAGCADIVTVDPENSMVSIELALSQFLKQSRAEHQQMGANARQCFAENFTGTQFAHRLREIVKMYEKN